MPVIEQWLFAEAIARQYQLLPSSVPDGDGEHTPQPGKARRAELLKGMDDDFRVAVRGEVVPQLLQLAGRSSAPLLPPVGGRFLQAQAYRAITGRVPHEYLLELVTGGQVADTARLLHEFGWQPPRSSKEVAAAFFALPTDLARTG